jgi:hypothetical protein
MEKKTLAAIISLVLFLCSAISLGIWIKLAFDAQNRVNEATDALDKAKQDVEAAKEQYAQALAIDKTLPTLAVM